MDIFKQNYRIKKITLPIFTKVLKQLNIAQLNWYTK